MRKFLLKMVVLGVFISLIPVCNYVVDPSHVYDSGSYEQKIVDILLTRKNTTNVDANLNERFLKRFLAQQASKKQDYLVLGPSRSMLISEKVLSDGQVLNLSLSGASLEDMVSMYWVSKLSGIHTRNLIVCLDPQVFNERNMDQRWKDNESYYNAFLQRRASVDDQSSNADLMRFKNLFSIAYFQNSVKSMVRRSSDYLKGKPTNLVVTDQYDNPGATIHYDGSRSYDEAFRHPKLDDVNAMASKWTYHQFDNYQSLSETYQKVLQDFINQVKLDGVRIYVLCAPYHPRTYQKIQSQKRYATARLAMTYIQQLIHTNRLEVVGSYNPDSCGCDETCFYDGVHLNDEGVARLFQRK